VRRDVEPLQKTLRRVLREQLRKAAMLCRSAALVSPAGTL
jgi:hypothetical protein